MAAAVHPNGLGNSQKTKLSKQVDAPDCLYMGFPSFLIRTLVMLSQRVNRDLFPMHGHVLFLRSISSSWVSSGSRSRPLRKSFARSCHTNSRLLQWPQRRTHSIYISRCELHVTSFLRSPLFSGFKYATRGSSASIFNDFYSSRAVYFNM